MVTLAREGTRTEAVKVDRVPERSFVYKGLSALPEEYTALFAESGADSFFCSLPWFRNLCATAIDPEDEVRIYATELTNAERTPTAALLLRCSPFSSWEIRPRTLHSLTNFYTSFYAPLLSQVHGSPASLARLVRAVCSDTPAPDAVNLKWLDPEAKAFEGLRRAFKSAGMVVQTYFSAGNWYLPVNEMSYPDYLQSLRSSVRNIATSKNKKIERSGRARVEIVTGLDGLEPAVEAYERVYAASWKVQEPYPEFIPGLIRTCAKQGWLRLGIVYMDGEPAAAQVWIVHNAKAAIYKMAYNKRFRDLSLGSFLTMRMMEYVLDADRVREVDYLTGDDAYKKDWMSHRRERWGMLALNPRTVRGVLAIARHVGGRAVKRTLFSLGNRLRREGRPKPA